MTTVNIRNLTKQTILMDNVFIQPGGVQSISELHYNILKKNYGDKIEIVNIDQDELKKMQVSVSENESLKKRIVELETTLKPVSKEKSDKTEERLQLESKAKELGIRGAHLMGDSVLENKILEVETAPQQ